MLRAELLNSVFLTLEPDQMVTEKVKFYKFKTSKNEI